MEVTQLLKKSMNPNVYPTLNLINLVDILGTQTKISMFLLSQKYFKFALHKLTIRYQISAMQASERE